MCAGALYVVATPLGNLGDICERARAVLSSVDCVACEDTRVTGKLLSLLGISKKLVSYRDENERTMSTSLLGQLQSGSSLALCSDAGTPCISDPGFRLVRACKAAGVPVMSVPGPCSIIAAL
ncbi:MAG: rRNA (cytidine-2'-O-)-methyltransferase, partial [Verrucomicrobia bacterium 21-51-4]